MFDYRFPVQALKSCKSAENVINGVNDDCYYTAKLNFRRLGAVSSNTTPKVNKNNELKNDLGPQNVDKK